MIYMTEKNDVQIMKLLHVIREFEYEEISLSECREEMSTSYPKAREAIDDALVHNFVTSRLFHPGGRGRATTLLKLTDQGEYFYSQNVGLLSQVLPRELKPGRVQRERPVVVKKEKVQVDESIVEPSVEIDETTLAALLSEVNDESVDSSPERPDWLARPIDDAEYMRVRFQDGSLFTFTEQEEDFREEFDRFVLGKSILKGSKHWFLLDDVLECVPEDWWYLDREQILKVVVYLANFYRTTHMIYRSGLGFVISTSDEQVRLVASGEWDRNKVVASAKEFCVGWEWSSKLRQYDDVIDA